MQSNMRDNTLRHAICSCYAIETMSMCALAGSAGGQVSVRQGHMKDKTPSTVGTYSLKSTRGFVKSKKKATLTLAVLIQRKIC